MYFAPHTHVTMRYESTRGGQVGVSFEEAVLAGLADDGGLFVPENVPHVPLTTLAAWTAQPVRARRVARVVDQLATHAHTLPTVCDAGDGPNAPLYRRSRDPGRGP
jgi:threonine synthase